MADEKIIQELQIAGAQQAQRDLEQVGRTGADALNRVADAGKRLDGAAEGLGRVANQTGPLGKLERAAEKLGLSIRKTGESFDGAKASIIGAKTVITGAISAIAGGLVLLVNSASKATSAIKEAGIAAGTTAQEIARMGFAARQSGADAGKLERAFALITAGGDDLEKKLAQFNVRLKNANGTARDSSEVFKDFATAISDIQDPAQRSAAAAEVFGKRLGPGLVELLQQGRAGIEALGKEAERLGLVFTEAELKIGKDFGDSMDKLTSSFGALRTRIGLAFSPALQRIIDAMTEAIAGMTPAINELTQAFVAKLKPVVDDIVALLAGKPEEIKSGFLVLTRTAVLSLGGAIRNVLIPALTLLGQMMDTVAGAFNSVFGTSITAADVGIFLVIGKITGALGALLPALGLVTNALRVMGLAATAAFGPWGIAIAAITIALGFLAARFASTFNFEELKTSATEFWNGLTAAIGDAATAVVERWDAVRQFFDELWTAISEGATNLWDEAVEVFNSVAETITGAWETVKTSTLEAWENVKKSITEALTPVIEFIDKIVAGIKRVIEFAKAAAKALGEMANARRGGAAPAAAGLAGGGMVRGPGTSTSDSIPAWLSDFEFVMRAKAVRYYGPAFMHALNRLQIPLDALRSFSLGGLTSAVSAGVSRSIPRFADGGLARSSPGRPVYVTIGDNQYQFAASDDVIDRLINDAKVRESRSTGRRPSYVGGGRR